jgi:hypothetical protein
MGRGKFPGIFFERPSPPKNPVERYLWEINIPDRRTFWKRETEAWNSLKRFLKMYPYSREY